MRGVRNGGRRVLRLVLACLLALAAAVALPASPAHADTSRVTVALTSVSPSWLGNGKITITGTVTNTSTVPMSQVQVLFWRSFDPITDQAQLAGVISSPEDVPLGARATDPDGNLFNITSEHRPRFMPDETATFTVTATREQLGLPTTHGAYLVGVHVRAIPEGDINQSVGRARVLLPAEAPERGSISPVVVLASRPSMVKPGVLADDHLVAELRGRLTALLAVAEDPTSVVLIDPSLYDELTAMTTGYTLVSGTPDVMGAPLAAEWLARFRAIVNRPGVYRLPYGDPELMGLPDEVAGTVAAQAANAMPDDHDLSGLGVALAPRSGQADAGLLTRTRVLQPTLLVTSQTGAPPAGSSQGVTVLNADPKYRSGGPGPKPSTTPPQLVGRLLTELTLADEPSAVLVVREVGDTRLVRGVPSTIVRRSALEVPSAPTQLPQKVSVKPVDPGLYDEIARARSRMIAWGDLTGTGAQARVLADQLGARTTNGAFGATTSAARDFLAQAVGLNGRDVSSAQAHLSSAQSFVMSTDTSSFPVTITNGEQVPISVKVRFTSENPQRLTVPDTDVVTVAPGETASVNFTPKASDNGVVSVVAQIVTPTGDPVGQSRHLTVTATSLGDVGWLIIIASGVVLLGTTALRIKQVQRERAKVAAAKATVTTEVDLAAEADRRSRDHSGRPHP